MTNGRILWADALKSFAITIVVLGHCLQFLNETGILYKYIYAFHMPLFMAISGYCSYKPLITLNSIKRRFFQLVIPFFCWPIVWYVVRMDFSGIADYYIHLPLNPDTGLWFLYILFLISLVDYIRYRLWHNFFDSQFAEGGGKKYLFQYECSIIVSVIFLLIIYWAYKRARLPGNWISFLALYYPYYMLGCVMRRHSDLLERHLWWLGSVGLLVFCFATYFLEGRIWQPLLAISGIFGAFFVFNRYCDCKMPQLVAFTGMSTLGIYAVHQPVINYVKHIIGTPVWVDVALTFVITCTISLVVVRILKMSRMTRFLLLGMNK